MSVAALQPKKDQSCSTSPHSWLSLLWEEMESQEGFCWSVFGRFAQLNAQLPLPACEQTEGDAGTAGQSWGETKTDRQTQRMSGDPFLKKTHKYTHSSGFLRRKEYHTRNVSVGGRVVGVGGGAVTAGVKSGKVSFLNSELCPCYQNEVIYPLLGITKWVRN